MYIERNKSPPRSELMARDRKFKESALLPHLKAQLNPKYEIPKA